MPQWRENFKGFDLALPLTSYAAGLQIAYIESDSEWDLMADSGAGRSKAGLDDAGFGRIIRALILLLALAAAVILAVAAFNLRAAAPIWPVGLSVGAAALCLLAWFTVSAELARQPDFRDEMINSLNDPMVLTDARGRAVFANAAYRRLAGGLVSMEGLFTGQPDFSEPVYKLSQAALEGKSAEREIRLPPGSPAPTARVDSPVWLRLKVTPGHGQGCNLWQLTDISNDRARQEQAFARLQYIITYLDHGPAGFFSTIPGGKVDYLNATLAGWLGLDVTEADSGALKLSDVVGKDGCLLLSAVEAEPGGAVTETFEFDLTDARGQPMPVQIIHRVDFAASGEAQPSRSLVLPRALMANADDDASLRLTRFIAMAPLGIAVISADSDLREANAAFLELSTNLKRGAKLSALVGEVERSCLSEACARAMAHAGQPQLVAVTIAAETPRLVELILLRLSADDTNVTVFATDTTERKALEVQLAQSQKMQAVGQLASGIAHDFNNVLTPIIGFADLLLAKLRPTDPAFADIMNIKQNAHRAANLVRQLLAFSRRQTLQPKVHALTEALSDLDSLLRRSLGEKVKLTINHARGLGLVLVDINQFEQVIINLAVNARDAMPEGGTLTVTTVNVSLGESRKLKAELLPPGEYVACVVEDTGSGIPADVLAKMWEPFFSTKEVGKGTGLGLSTVYGIVKQTGGFIFCDSVVGKGTKFRIYLPRHYPAAVAAAETVAAPKKRVDHTGIGRILLVEDEDSVRAYALRALTSRGYTVIEADSGESALEVIDSDSEGFDLILSDVVMPEMDGPTLLREIRERGIKTRIIFVSGYAADAFEKNLEGQSDFVFLPKPFSLKELIEKVKEVMES